MIHQGTVGAGKDLELDVASEGRTGHPTDTDGPLDETLGIDGGEALDEAITSGVGGLLSAKATTAHLALSFSRVSRYGVVKTKRRLAISQPSEALE